MKFSLLTICVIYALVSLANGSTVTGGATYLRGNDLKNAETILENALSKLSAGGGPSYKIAKINSVITRVVAGTLVEYDVDLVNNENNVQNCNVEMWTQEWMGNDSQMTIACSAEKEISYNA